MAMGGTLLADEEMRKAYGAVPFKSNGALTPATHLFNDFNMTKLHSFQ